MKEQDISIAELVTLPHSAIYAQWADVPISPTRAIAQAQNPMALPTDTALHLVLGDHDQLLAYLGIVPTTLADGSRAGCMSCLWVHPEARGQSLAKALVHRVRQAWQGRLLITDYIPQVYGLYHRHLQLVDMPMATGGIFYLKNLIQGRHMRRNRKAGLHWAWADSMINLWGHKPPKVWQPLQPIPTALAQPVVQHQAVQDALPKTPELLAWQDLPWLSPTEACPRYYFSSMSPDYRAGWYASPDGQVVLYLLYRRGELKVKYVYGADSDLPEAAKSVLALAYGMGAHTLHCPHTALAAAIAPLRRWYLFYKKYTPMLLLGQPLAHMAHRQWQVGDLDSHYT